MKQNKSAKDVAFDKERTKFRSEIKKLQYQIRDKDKQIESLRGIISEKENEIARQNKQIDILLEYAEISKEELQKLIKDKKEERILRERISSMLNVLDRFEKMGSYF